MGQLGFISFSPNCRMPQKPVSLYYKGFPACLAEFIQNKSRTDSNDFLWVE